MTAVTIPCLLFLLFFVAGARRLAPEGAAPALGAVALGSMALPYAMLFFSHQLAAAFVGAAFVLAMRREGFFDAVGIGLLCGMAILCDYQAGLAVLVVGGYLLVRSRSRLRDLVGGVLGGLPPMIVLGFYHWVCFGSPFRTGYSFAPDPAHKQGVLGLVGPSREAIGQTLFRPDNGLFFLSPWVAVALIGGFALLGRKDVRKRIGGEIVACLAVVLLSLLFVCSLAPEFGRGGWSVGPRYACAAIPFAGWLLAATLGTYRSAVVWTIAGATILYSVLVHVVAATTYPHWPIGVTNPLWEISIRALRENLAPYSLGTWLGARGVLSLVPVFLVAAATAWWLVVRGWKTGVVAVAAAGLAIALTSRIPTKTPPSKWDFVERTWAPKR